MTMSVFWGPTSVTRTVITQLGVIHAAATLDTHSVVMDLVVQVCCFLRYQSMSLNIKLIPDVDECTLRTDTCSQNCHDTPGSYTCSCNSGYILSDNGYNCNGNVDSLHNYFYITTSCIFEHAQ